MRPGFDARARALQAEQQIRLLLAYAREFTWPRPYRLVELAGGGRDVHLRGAHRLR